jgi:hypothetical protein
MNCVNHPEAAVAAYCQNCGKALCTECVRSVSGVIYCEQCLAAKLGYGPAGAPTTSPGAIPPPPSEPNMGLATLLGFIPGVGAMYNGQFVKAIVHVLVFVVLIGIAGDHPIFLIFIFAWVFYQVFDANQTAKARRDGLPLPDPFGLNELGNRMGIPSSPGSYVGPPPIPGPGPAAYQPPYQTPYQAPFVPPAANVPPANTADFTPVPPYEGYAPPMVPPDVELQAARREPIGAIVLIGLGMLFLFNTLGLLSFDWIGRGWPLLVIGIGAWLLIKRTRSMRTPPPPPPTGGVQ